jgi:hypothetical protein
LAGFVFACETEVPDDQIQANVSSASHRSGDEKPTTPKKTKPSTSTASAGTTAPNTTPTTTDASPTTPATNAPPAAGPPPAADPPVATDPPPATDEELVEVDCCVGPQFIACGEPSGTQCADVDISTDCEADPEFDDICQ